MKILSEVSGRSLGIGALFAGLIAVAATFHMTAGCLNAGMNPGSSSANLPSAVGDVVATGSAGKVTVTWGDEGAAGYKVYWTSSPEIVSLLSDVSATKAGAADVDYRDVGSALSYEHIVDCGIEHYYAVVAYDDQGNEVAPASMAHAHAEATGTMDTAFGTDGVLAIPYGGSEILTMTMGMQIDANGNLVIGGISMVEGSEDPRLSLWRMTTAGVADTSFGSAGEATYPGENGAWGGNVALDGEGRIVVAGIVPEGEDYRLVVWRYESGDGALDENFGAGGIFIDEDTVIRLGHYNLLPISGLAIDASNRIIVAGRVYTGGEHRFAIWRVASDGKSLDWRYVDDSASWGEGMAMDAATDASGGILVAGFVEIGEAGGGMFLLRLTDAGEPDPAFGDGDGFVIEGTEHVGVGITLAVDAAGAILVGGGLRNYDGGDLTYAIWRFTPEGILDTSFGTGGLITGMPGYSYVLDILADAAGGAVAVIVSGDPDTELLTTLVRLGSTGALDSSFDSDGTLALDLPVSLLLSNQTIVDSSGCFYLASTSTGDGAGIGSHAVIRKIK